MTGICAAFGRFLSAALVGAFILAHPALAAAPVARVPFRIDYSGWFTVSVMVNGEGPYDFIIDTGATESLIFENLAKKQRFSPTGGPPRTVFGLAAAGKFPPYFIGDIAVADGVRLIGHDSVILADWTVDEASPQGVFGLDLLRLYVLVFDTAAMELSFYEPGAEIDTPDTWRAIDLESRDFGMGAGDLYTLTAALDRVRVTFLLDLGASGTIINYAAVKKYRSQYRTVDYGLHPTRMRDRITDALGETNAVQAYRIKRIRAGAARWGQTVIYSHPADIFEEIGVADEAFGLFGANMFVDRSFLIDFPRKKILAGPPIR